MRVPVEISAVTDDGSALEESTHTGVVGVLGAMIRTSRLLSMGSELAVTNRFSNLTAKFRVVWTGANQKDGLWEIGIEALQPLNDFGGVRFPPKTDSQ